jgi:hypothetical protein
MIETFYFYFSCVLLSHNSVIRRGEEIGKAETEASKDIQRLGMTVKLPERERELAWRGGESGWEYREKESERDKRVKEKEAERKRERERERERKCFNEIYRGKSKRKKKEWH